MIGSDGGEDAARFFSVKQAEERRDSGASASLNPSTESDEGDRRGCLTIRIFQYLLPCVKRRGVWEPSQGDVFKSHDAEEAKYPKTLRILESPVFDAIFVMSCLASIYLFLFSEGFLIESRLLWGIIHVVNAVYALGLFSQWLQILIKSKYAKTNHGYTTLDIVYTLLSVFPADLIVLAIYTLNDEDDTEESEASNPIQHWMITISRLNYLLRFRSIFQYFSKWENHLVVGDFRMFLLKTFVCGTFILHSFACVWHRLACNSFRLKHFLMTPDEATAEVCTVNSWLGILKEKKEAPLLDHPDRHVLATHYFVSVYWTIIAAFRLGSSDIRTSLGSDDEIAFVSLAEITAWIYVLASISGTLTSLLIEKDTDKENFLIRCFAIRRYLSFAEVPRTIYDDVMRFYKYLWEKNKGILHFDLMDLMPYAMKSEVFYDVNKFVLDQLPMLKSLETPFLMSLSVHMGHRFYLSGEILYKRNDTPIAMYYLLKGHLEVLDEDDKQAIATIRSGSVIGEIHLLQPFPLTATVRCGSNCDVLVLSRKHFKRVLNSYPQYISTLEQRLESRLEQSGLLLALCEKHNTYHKAFKALREFNEQLVESDPDFEFPQSEFGQSFENVTKILSNGVYVDVTSPRDSDDFDGLTLNSDMEGRIVNRPIHSLDRADRRTYDELLVAALEALETDVARAGSLASDLNIPRPPLIVSSPDISMHLSLGFKQATSENIFVRMFKIISDSTESNKGRIHFAWKLLVSICALLVFWYYPYQFAFRETSHIPVDYAMHATDIIFALNCYYDMMQAVVTPQKSFESAKEIFIYRLKSIYFYFRIVSFIPFEYAFSPLVGDSDSPYFYLFKMNRLLEVHLVFRLLSDAEVYFRFSPVLMTLGKLALGMFSVTHIFTVIYTFIKRDINLDPVVYRHGFYWTIQYVAALGYGDFRSTTNLEIAVEVFALIIGVSTVMYLQATVSSMLVNGERRRMSFKQTYYGLQEYMKRRKFSKSLLHRICRYYKLQWRSHEGTLIPTDKPVIWDAPKTLLTDVSNAHSYKYISRIPIFMKAPLNLQNEMCVGMKHYILPPHEVLLYPDELARDLYIISKGFVEVIHENKQIGVFSEGRYFGLRGLMYGVNTHFMFRTMTHCQLFCLSHESFMKIANANPNFLHEIDHLSALADDAHGETANANPESGSTQEGDLPPYPLPLQNFLSELVAKGLPFREFPDEDDNDKPIFANIISNLCSRLKTQFSTSYFLPNGLGLKLWMAFRIPAAILVTIFAIAQTTFPISPWISFFIMIFFDAIAWLDIFVSSRIAYFGSQNQLVTNKIEMIRHYLNGPFLLDLLACFPGDMIAFFILSQFPDYYNLYHVISLLRINRVLQCNKVVLTNKLLGRVVYKSLGFVMLLQMMPIMFIFFNLTTCFCVLRVCGVSTNGKPSDCIPNAWILNGLQRLDNLTVHKDGIENSDATTRFDDTIRSYIVGLYWVAQTVSSTGFGDIEIGTVSTNQRLVIHVLFCGILTVTYVGGRLTSCMVGEDPIKNEIQEKMKLMNNYLEQHRTSNNSRRRVHETYLNAWEKTRGVSPTALFLSLPPTMKTDVMKHLYGGTLRASPLFHSLEGPGLRMLSSSLSEIFYPEGEFLMKFGDLCSDIFFIAHGVVVCYNVRGEIMSQMGRGSIIGEIAPVFQNHRLYSAIAVKDVNAYVFTKDAFMNFLNLYPQIKTELEMCSVKHYQEAMIDTNKKSGDNYGMLTFRNDHSRVSKQGTGEEDSLEKYVRAGISVTLKKSSEIKSGTDNFGPDLTRNILKDDLMKSPEDFSKITTDKWWSVFVSFGRMARDEMGLVHIYQELDQCTIFNFTVHPSSSACQWVSFCLVLAAVSCSITAYEIAFSNGPMGPSESIPLMVMRYMLELFFVIRIIGNFHLGYYDETATLITDVTTISRRYMYKIDGMWLDIVTTFPFYFITDFIGTGIKGEYIRSLQLLRVCLFVRYLNESDTSLKTKAPRVKVLKITILLCFIFHFWACAWYLVACYEASCSRGSWMHHTLGDLEINFNIPPTNVSIASRYLLSLYYVTNTLTCTGFSEITGRTNIELILTITMIFGTVFFIGYLVGEMAQSLVSQMSTKIHFQHKLSVLENHFMNLGISDIKIGEVRHYFKLLWCRCRGVDLYDLMEELPYSLRADVAMEIYGPNMKSSRILGKLDENLIRQICAKIRHEVYFPGSHLVRAGDVCTSMYFIKKGEVVILDGNSNLELCVEILYESECFGEVKILLPREQYRFSYVARLESEVGVLHKDDLEAILKNHPRLFDELKEKAHRVKIRRQSLKEEEERLATPPGIVVTNSQHSIKSGTSHTSAKQ